MAGSNDKPVGYMLKRVQHELRLRMDHALAAEQVTLAQYAALSSLVAEPGLTNADLARRSFVTPQTMIRIVSDLERSGLITRRQDPDHGRRILNVITAAGRRRIEVADRIAAEIDAAMLAGFSASDQKKLVTLLSRCFDNMTGE